MELLHSWKTPDQTVIVATTPRSGSSYFCRLLDTSGLLRATREYFNDEDIERLGGSPHSTDDEKLSFIDRHSRTVRNQISLKLFPPNMARVLNSKMLSAAFARPCYIYLQRRDILGQAISLVRASKTGQWNSIEYGPPVETEYDEAEIAFTIRLLVSQNSWWDIFFATRQASVIRLDYEDVEADPAAACARCVAFLGFEPALFRADPENIALHRQRDALNEAWRSRFLASRPPVTNPWDGRPKARNLRNALLFLRGRL